MRDPLGGVTRCTHTGQRLRQSLVVVDCDFLVRRNHGLNRAPGIHAQAFRLPEEQAGADERDNNPSRSYRQQELSPLAVHQQYAANGHHKIHDCEKNVAPMRLHVGKTTLQKNIRVVANDGVDTSGLVARENDASQHKRNYILAAQERFLNLGPG